MSQQIFGDGIKNVAYANGVLRVEFYALTARNEQIDAGTLVLPINQAGTVINNLTTAMKQLGEKVREAQAQQQTSGESKSGQEGQEQPQELYFGE